MPLQIPHESYALWLLKDQILQVADVCSLKYRRQVFHSASNNLLRFCSTVVSKVNPLTCESQPTPYGSSPDRPKSSMSGKSEPCRWGPYWSNIQQYEIVRISYIRYISAKSEFELFHAMHHANLKTHFCLSESQGTAI